MTPAPPVKVEIEPDGLPSQIPPMQRVGPMSDDPAEPFSPNYGSPLPRSAMAPETAGNFAPAAGQSYGPTSGGGNVGPHVGPPAPMIARPIATTP